MKKQVGKYDMFPKVKMFPQIIQLLKKINAKLGYSKSLDRKISND